MLSTEYKIAIGYHFKKKFRKLNNSLSMIFQTIDLNKAVK